MTNILIYFVMIKSIVPIAAIFFASLSSSIAQNVFFEIQENDISSNGSSIDQSRFTTFYGVDPIKSGESIGQTFTATETGEVKTISLHGTYSIWAAGEITCQIYDRQGGEFLASSPDFSDVKNVDGHVFSFPNFKTKKGESYYISFIVNYIGHLLYHHEGEIYDGGTAYYNDVPAGSDIPFMVCYKDGIAIESFVSGCTDELAINYNSNAKQDDGSCFFDCIPPTVVFTSEPCENGIYAIEVQVLDLGNAGPYLISNSINDETIAVDFTGAYKMSGFEAATDVIFNFKSAISNTCNLQSEAFGCALGIEETSDFNLSMSPNPAQNSVFLRSDNNLLAMVTVVDLSGKIMLTTSGMIHAGAGLELNTKQLPTGAYLVNIVAGEYSITKRLLINK